MEQGKRRQLLQSDHICFNFLKGVPERNGCHRAHLHYFQIYNSLPRIVKVRCFCPETITPQPAYIILPACTPSLRLGRFLAYTLLTRKRRRPQLLLCTRLTDRQWSGYPEPGSPERQNTPLSIHSTHSTLFGFPKHPFLIDRAPRALHWIQLYAILDIRGRNGQAQIE